MIIPSLFVSAILATTVYGAATTNKAAEGKPKIEPAAGHFAGYGYSQPAYYGAQFLPPLLQDRYVCDLDASVLLVTDSHRHHHRHPHQFAFGGAGASRAVRVKCSDVASYDEKSCNLCCQQTARRDTTLPNNKLFGFLALTKSTDDETVTRSKRHVEDEDIEDEDRRRNDRFHQADPTYLVRDNWKPKPYLTNVKCVCCAPRPTSSTNGNGASQDSTTTYNAPASAAQPFVDTWQSDSATWGAGADAAAAPAAAPGITPESKNY